MMVALQAVVGSIIVACCCFISSSAFCFGRGPKSDYQFTLTFDNKNTREVPCEPYHGRLKSSTVYISICGTFDHPQCKVLKSKGSRLLDVDKAKDLHVVITGCSSDGAVLAQTKLGGVKVAIDDGTTQTIHERQDNQPLSDKIKYKGAPLVSVELSDWNLLDNGKLDEGKVYVGASGASNMDKHNVAIVVPFEKTEVAIAGQRNSRKVGVECSVAVKLGNEIQVALYKKDDVEGQRVFGCHIKPKKWFRFSVGKADEIRSVTLVPWKGRITDDEFRKFVAVYDVLRLNTKYLSRTAKSGFSLCGPRAKFVRYGDVSAGKVSHNGMDITQPPLIHELDIQYTHGLSNSRSAKCIHVGWLPSDITTWLSFIEPPQQIKHDAISVGSLSTQKGTAEMGIGCNIEMPIVEAKPGADVSKIERRHMKLKTPNKGMLFFKLRRSCVVVKEESQSEGVQSAWAVLLTDANVVLVDKLQKQVVKQECTQSKYRGWYFIVSFDELPLVGDVRWGLACVIHNPSPTIRNALTFKVKQVGLMFECQLEEAQLDSEEESVYVSDPNDIAIAWSAFEGYSFTLQIHKNNKIVNFGVTGVKARV